MALKAGFYVIWNHIPELIVAVEANSRQAPKRVCDKIAARMRETVAVDTGFTKSTIGSESIETGKSAEVFAGGAAAYLEYGTYKMAAQPFMSPAVADYEEEFLLEVAAPVLGTKVPGA